MDTLKTMKGTLYSVRHPVESIRFVITEIFDLFFLGGAQIITCFQYGKEESRREYSFRTVVQLDADVINFVPADPNRHVGNTDWTAAFAEAYGQHQNNLGQFTAQLDRFKSLVWTAAGIIAGIIVVIIDLSNKIFLQAGQDAWLLLPVLVWLVGSILVKQYAMPRLLRWLTRGIFLLAKRKWLAP